MGSRTGTVLSIFYGLLSWVKVSVGILWRDLLSGAGKFAGYVYVLSFYVIWCEILERLYLFLGLTSGIGARSFNKIDAYSIELFLKWWDVDATLFTIFLPEASILFETA